jgi:2-C-methyl-D-erythritol 4-phosphate cytidylyltransferase
VKISAIVSVRGAEVLVPVAGQPALRRVVQALSSAGLHSVVVAVAPPLAADVGSVLAGTAATVLEIAVGDGIAGAVEHVRAQSVSHALVADPRQVLISPGVIERVVAALSGGAAKVVPVVPVTDTVKTVDGQGRILTTVDRSELRTGQYPYGVAIGAPDGAEVVTVEGDPDAILADLPADAALIEALITCR